VKKLLLDECIPRKFKNYLTGYDCQTVPEAGWAGKRNGDLLSLAENSGFQVLISLDQGIEFQQNLMGAQHRSFVIPREVEPAGRFDPPR
jgi:hypothetical protein